MGIYKQTNCFIKLYFFYPQILTSTVFLRERNDVRFEVSLDALPSPLSDVKLNALFKLVQIRLGCFGWLLLLHSRRRATSIEFDALEPMAGVNAPVVQGLAPLLPGIPGSLELCWDLVGRNLAAGAAKEERFYGSLAY